MSSSFIALLSLFVIAMVVWLSLLFLSVTSGIEKAWLGKMTAMHAPIRIYPTKKYFAQKDSEEEFAFSYKPLKNYRRKEVLPSKKKALVSSLYDALEKCSKTLVCSLQDYECAPSLFHLHLKRFGKTSQIAQMSYLLSFPENNPKLQDLLLPPEDREMPHLLSTLQTKEELRRFFSHVTLKTTKKTEVFFPVTSLPDGIYQVKEKEDALSFIMPPSLHKDAYLLEVKKGEGTLKNQGKISALPKSAVIRYQSEKERPLLLDQSALFSEKKEEVRVSFLIESLGQKKRVSAPLRAFSNISFKPHVHFDVPVQKEPLWPYCVGGKWHLPKGEKEGIILPKGYKKSGALLGDSGYFSFIASSFSSPQEMRIACKVLGFYDPGVIPIGSRCIYTRAEVTETILGSSETLLLSPEMQNGIGLWPPLSNVDAAKKITLSSLETRGLAPYFHIETFRDYPFARELLAQFQSDRLLFLLVAALMILVACSNIISLLLLLVKEKKREIAILSALGAPKKSILLIFGGIGAFLGTLGSVIGSFLAYITLKNLAALVNLFSWMQGQEAFQEAFFGKSLPDSLSYEALYFLLIVTPIVSTIAAIIPAYKASKVHPAKELRS